MQQMPQTQPGSNPGAHFYVPQETPRLLETSDGWRLVGYNDRLLAKAGGDVQVSSFQVPVGDSTLEGESFFIPRLYWTQHRGILVMQGAPMQKVIGPNYLVIGFIPCVAWDPRPHVEDLLLARVTSAPEGMGLEEALVAIRRCY